MGATAGEKDSLALRAVASGANLLGQDVWWTGRDGITRLVDDLEPDHRRFIARMLIDGAAARYARLRRRQIFLELARAQMYTDDTVPLTDSVIEAQVRREQARGAHLDAVRRSPLFQRMVSGLDWTHAGVAEAAQWSTSPRAYPESLSTERRHAARIMAAPSGTEVHIDTRIVPLIASLWNAGIATLFSCGGGAPDNPHHSRNLLGGGAYVTLRDPDGRLFNALTRRCRNSLDLSRGGVKVTRRRLDRTSVYWPSSGPVERIQQLILDANKATETLKESR
ncbi:Uncharacterised protein (plasmid) [Tsukamurella tyrosinosolvens]|uniref:Uncharacterized protein n=2 Tax=Tsukamurella tyrosinosolvens TaxID=57704 RepID=A0A1H4UEJ6_TSUTY|nr:hypothetical protein AXK58_13815 [Tsukamurella tyrosinosolvens]SEC67169.1 hypothetical protein SAMN04489793_2875 [Tsukamurella tyrosinosolvens]VEH94171.1 Uncharacterised protein [Tsukamurella tyrosinosolvens]